MRRRALVLAALLIAACGGAAEDDPGRFDIETETDCGVLDREFVEAIEEAESLRERGEEEAADERQAFADAANRRANELGCYG